MHGNLPDYKLVSYGTIYINLHYLVTAKETNANTTRATITIIRVQRLL